MIYEVVGTDGKKHELAVDSDYPFKNQYASSHEAYYTTRASAKNFAFLREKFGGEIGAYYKWQQSVGDFWLPE